MSEKNHILNIFKDTGALLEGHFILTSGRHSSMYFQCARAIRRAGLWDAAMHCDRASLPSAGDLIRSVDPEFDGTVYDNTLADRQSKTLY